MAHGAAIPQRPVELGRFLRTRRERLTPAVAGIEETANRRTLGLRREEVARRANVSVSWYIHLEQGRKVQPSPTVLDSLSTALGLSEAEHIYLYALATPATTAPPTADPKSADVARALVELHAAAPLPVVALNGEGAVLACNAATAAWYGPLSAPAVGANFAVWLYTDPVARARILNWHVVVRCYTATLRFLIATTGGGEYRDLAQRLARVSSQFRRDWDDHQVAAPGACPLTFARPDGAPVTLDMVAVRPTASSTSVLFHVPASAGTAEQSAVGSADDLLRRTAC